MYERSTPSSTRSTPPSECLNICEAVGSGSEELKKMPSPFSCSPVIRECSWKKTLIEKKKEDSAGNILCAEVQKTQ